MVEATLTPEAEAKVINQADELMERLADRSSIAENALKMLSAIEENRKAWQEGPYKTSNRIKYMILEKCRQFCGELPISESKMRSKALEEFYKARGYKYKHDAPLATRVVRAVFGLDDRRRVATYSTVIRQAQKENVPYGKMVDWIEGKGGVQEISLSKSSTYVSPSNKAKHSRDTYESLPILHLAKSEALSLQADGSFVGHNCVLLAQQQEDGGFAIRAVIRSDGAVNATFTALYSNLKKSQNETKNEQQVANDADGNASAA
jgi:hypothetical protein